MKKFKKIISVIIATMLVLSAFSLNANASVMLQKRFETIVSGDYEYRVYSDGTAEIEKYIGSDKNVVIPDTIDGYDVSRIGSKAFSNLTNIESVKIPKGVTYIGLNVFEDCSSLNNVVIPNGVKSIGWCAFQNCTSLSDITIPDSVNSIGKDTFNNTPWLDNQPEGVIYAGKVAYLAKGEMPPYTNITLKPGTTGIADDAFEGQENLYRVIVPDTVSSIGFGAFDGCVNLKYINIPYGVNIIEGDTFRNCRNLDNIVIPNSVKMIDYFAFERCLSLKSVTVPHTVQTIMPAALGFDYDFNEFKYIKIEGFTIKGYKGTAAEKYAEENGFDFIALSENALGDVDGNGVVSVADATNIQKYAAMISDFSSEQLVLADFNCDGVVNVTDATEIQRSLVN